MQSLPVSDPIAKTLDSTRFRIAIGESLFGWIGIVRDEQRLCRVLFDHATPRHLYAAWNEGESSDADGDSSCEVVEQDELLPRLQAFLAGESDDFLDVDLHPAPARPFTRRVVNACRRIKPGQTLTYADLAARAGSPSAARAVGNIMANNRFPLLVPCHRVLGSGGSLGGYSSAGGLATKQRLLDLESSQSRSNRPR